MFWDPLGYRCTKEIWSKLAKFFIGFTLTDLQSRVQYDGFQCGVWVCWAVETFTSLALDGKDWNRDTLLGAIDNTLAAYGLVNTLSNAKRNSSRISALVRQQFIDCIHHAVAQQSLSVDTLFPDGSIRGIALCQLPIQGSYPLALITHTMQRHSIFDMFL